MYPDWSSVSVSGGRDGATGEIEWFVSGGVEQALLIGAQKCGGYQASSSGSGEYLNPEPFPFAGGLFAQSFSVQSTESFDHDSGTWSPMAKLTVSYAEWEGQEGQGGGEEEIPEIPEGVIADISYSSSIEAVNLPIGQYKWSEGPDNTKALSTEDAPTPSILLPVKTLSIKMENVRSDPSSFDQYLGKVNSTKFMNKYEPRTVQLLTLDADTQLTTNGLKLWTVTLALQIRPQGFDKIFHPKDRKFYAVTPKPCGEDADLNGVWQLA